MGAKEAVKLSFTLVPKFQKNFKEFYNLSDDDFNAMLEYELLKLTCGYNVEMLEEFEVLKDDYNSQRSSEDLKIASELARHDQEADCFPALVSSQKLNTSRFNHPTLAVFDRSNVTTKPDGTFDVGTPKSQISHLTSSSTRLDNKLSGIDRECMERKARTTISGSFPNDKFKTELPAMISSDVDGSNTAAHEEVSSKTEVFHKTIRQSDRLKQQKFREEIENRSMTVLQAVPEPH